MLDRFTLYECHWFRVSNRQHPTGTAALNPPRSGQDHEAWVSSHLCAESLPALLLAVSWGGPPWWFWLPLISHGSVVCHLWVGMYFFTELMIRKCGFGVRLKADQVAVRFDGLGTLSHP